MLRGEYVVLRVPEIEDARIITAWKNDEEVARFLPLEYPQSRRMQENIIRQNGLDKNTIMFIIENEDRIPIGICSIKNVDWVNSNGKICIAIYAKNCWGRGYGYDAVKALTNYGMFEMNLHTLYASIPEDNERAVKCFQKAGYETEGVLYCRLFKDGQFRNLVSMSISREKRQEG